MTPRDQLWVDMTQFDTEVADGVWEGTTVDPDAPSWYRDLRSLIHRARGPAEPHELVDEPVTVTTMHRVALGRTLARIPRSSGVRTLGRVVAMKAAAATTASVVSVAAAAAATTGIVATVAATVVVPAVAEHVVPMIGDQLAPTVAAPIKMTSPDESDATAVHETADPGPSVVVDEPAASVEPVTGATDAGAPTLEVGLAVTPDPEPEPEAVETAPAPDPVTEDVPAEVPVEVPVEPAPVEPALVDPAAVDPAPSGGGTGETPVAAAEPEAPAEHHKPAEPGHPDHPEHPAEPGSPGAGGRRTTPMG